MLRGDESVAELALAAGAVGSSFDAEAFAAVRAFQEISELAITRGSTVRWFTDSSALNGQPRKYGNMMRKLWDSLENIMSHEVDIECVWIPSHCGLPKNDAADELARRGILESNLLIQQAVPPALESAQSIIRPMVRNSILRVPSLPSELTIPSRRAEAVLHQLMTN